MSYLLATPFAHAADFSAGRGISFDQWITWPNASRWNDNDVLENFPEWQKFIKDEDIKALTDTGLTTVRLPIDPAIFLHNKDEKRQALLMMGVHKAIERITAQGLKVIVDLHTIPYDEKSAAISTSKILDDDLVFISYLNLVEEFASQLVKYETSKVALELINEPQYQCDKSDLMALWQAQLSQLHKAARTINPNISLVLPGACYASAEGLTALDPKTFKDENIIWTFHSYEPFILTHQSAGWVGKPVSAFRNLPYPPSKLSNTTVEGMPNSNDNYISKSLSGVVRKNAGWYIRNEFEAWGSDTALETHLEKPFKMVARWAKQNNIAPDNIYLGEFGFIAQEYGNDFKTNPEWRIAYLKDMIALAEEYNFAWSMWSYGGAFGMVQSFGGEPMDGNLLEQLELNLLPNLQ